MGTGYEFILDCGIDSVVSDHELDIILQQSNSSDSVPIHKKKNELGRVFSIKKFIS